MCMSMCQYFLSQGIRACAGSLIKVLQFLSLGFPHPCGFLPSGLSARDVPSKLNPDKASACLLQPLACT